MISTFHCLPESFSVTDGDIAGSSVPPCWGWEAPPLLRKSFTLFPNSFLLCPLSGFKTCVYQGPKNNQTHLHYLENVVKLRSALPRLVESANAQAQMTNGHCLWKGFNLRICRLGRRKKPCDVIRRPLKKDNQDSHRVHTSELFQQLSGSQLSGLAFMGSIAGLALDVVFFGHHLQHVSAQGTVKRMTTASCTLRSVSSSRNDLPPYGRSP